MPMHLFFTLFLFAFFVLEYKSGLGYELALPSCDQTCGNITIPYPFGTREGCYLNEHFFINCARTTTDDHNPTAFLNNTKVNVTDINLSSGELRSWIRVARQCFDNGNLSAAESHQNILPQLSTFSISHTKNKLTVVGCDTYAFFKGNSGVNFTTGCMSICNRIEDVNNGSCAGSGCCQVSIPMKTIDTLIILKSFYNHINVSGFERCSYAFVVEEAYYTFNSIDLTRLSSVDRQPVILDWTIGNQTCEEARKDTSSYACNANSFCYDSSNRLGYRCNCSAGYEGNPYLPTGCQDIDECTNNPCIERCINSRGSFSCGPCRKGYEGDGLKIGTGCVLISSTEKSEMTLRVALGTSLGFIAVLLIGGGLHLILQKRKLNQLRKKYYKENGGFTFNTLQHLLSQHERQLNSFKIYTADELKKATHSYDDSKILGKGGQGTVYKGELVDNTIVAIKKSNAIDKSQVDMFVNEIIILSRTNHQNVVKLLGCCLETEIPMLVYEFITNGTLSDYIRKDRMPQMPWHTRVRIAAETAGAISYLHSAAAIPIIHRDIKTANILLDVGYTAKVSDFGVSKFAPVDKFSLATNVFGTPGYLDPEYYASGILSEKSDVYSFGVVLLELLTGAKPIIKERREVEKSLAFYFMSCMKEGRLDDIVDENLKRNVKGTQLEEVALMAARCLNERGEDRPSMKEVARVLERVAKREVDHPWVAIDLNDEQETGLLLRGPLRSNSASNTTSGNGYPGSG